jgi:hypothetical protein
MFRVPIQGLNSSCLRFIWVEACSRDIEQGVVVALWCAGGFMEQRIKESDRRDPEDRLIDENNRRERKDKMMDKTIADTFPASDPPSSLPDPDEDSFAATSVA